MLHKTKGTTTGCRPGAGARGGHGLRAHPRRHAGHCGARPHRLGRGAAGQGLRLQRHLLRPLPARRHREVARAHQGLHASGEHHYYFFCNFSF